MRKNSMKNTRINGEVQRVLAEIIRGDLKDPRIGPLTDLTALIVRAVRLAGVISGVMALKGIITDLAVIITALREATRDRMVDLSGAKSRVRVSIRRPRLRTRSAGMTRSAGLARRKIKSPGKTSSTKRTMQR